MTTSHDDQLATVFDIMEDTRVAVDGVTAEYWESPGKVTSAIQLAKGLVSDAEPDLGDNDTVTL